MPANTFSTGRDCTLVILGPDGRGGTARVDLTHVTGFDCRQLTNAIRIDRLDGVHLAAELPRGWEGSFELERGSSAVEDFIAALEQAWHATGDLPGSNLYQYIQETNGSTSTYQFEAAVFRLTSAGAWKGEGPVRQRLEFYASRRKRV